MPSTIGIVASSALNRQIFITSGPSLSAPLNAYKWSGSGFGTRYSNPATKPGSGRRVRFTPKADVVITTVFDAPFIMAYQFSYTSGFGTKYSDPSGGPTAANGYIEGVGFDISPSGNDLCYSVSRSGATNPPYFFAYPWSYSGGFGTKYADPATQTERLSKNIAFSPDGNNIAFTDGGSIVPTGLETIVYPWSGSGFGTKYADPATKIISPTDISWSPDGNTLAILGNSSRSWSICLVIWF